MRFLLDTIIDNDELPFIEPAQQLVRPSSLAVYDMLSTRDLSGNTALGFTGSFNSQGAILDTIDTAVNTNVLEQDTMSILLCLNLDPRPGTAFAILSNMTPGTAPFKGIRQVRSADSSGNFAVSTGLAAPNQIVAINSNMVGAWTTRVLHVKNDEISAITRAGAVTSGAVTSREKSPLPLCLNALPSDVATPTKTGTTGTSGIFCAYNEYLSDSDSVELMNTVKSIMAGRGMTIP